MVGSDCPVASRRIVVTRLGKIYPDGISGIFNQIERLVWKKRLPQVGTLVAQVCLRICSRAMEAINIAISAPNVANAATQNSARVVAASGGRGFADALARSVAQNSAAPSQALVRTAKQGSKSISTQSQSLTAKTGTGSGAVDAANASVVANLAAVTMIPPSFATTPAAAEPPCMQASSGAESCVAQGGAAEGKQAGAANANPELGRANVATSDAVAGQVAAETAKVVNAILQAAASVNSDSTPNSTLAPVAPSGAPQPASQNGAPGAAAANASPTQNVAAADPALSELAQQARRLQEIVAATRPGEVRAPVVAVDSKPATKTADATATTKIATTAPTSAQTSLPRQEFEQLRNDFAVKASPVNEIGRAS